MGEVINMNSVHSNDFYFVLTLFNNTIILTKIQPTSDRNELPQRNEFSHFYDILFSNLL